MLLDDGEGFVCCACGRQHWGRYGAAGLLLHDPQRGVLLQHRAAWTHHGSTWALPGGAVLPGETPEQAAARETEEETAVPVGSVRILSSCTDDHGDWRYTTVLGVVQDSVEPRAASAESVELHWVQPEQVARYPLHRDFAAAWPRLCGQLDRQLVLIVDGANVMGARPDGWWHDRAAGAARLRDRLAVLSDKGVVTPDGLEPDGRWYWWPRIILVTEGKARHVAGVAGVEVVGARADGDDEVVATARGVRAARPRDHVVVVTADRQLRRRVSQADCALLGPAGLWRLLDQTADFTG